MRSIRRAIALASSGPAALILGTVLGASDAIASPVDALMQAMSGTFAATAPTGAPSIQDLGPVAIGSPLATTVYLSPRDPEALDAFVAAVQTPSDRRFHQFLTQGQFVARFAPTDATIAAVEQALTQAGFKIGTLYANHLALEVFAPAGTTETAFGLDLHRFSRNGRIGTWSTTNPTMPASIRSVVRGVGGFDTLLPRHGGATKSIGGAALAGEKLGATAAAASGITDPAGQYTPMDYEKYYDVLPLVKAGATGKGTTIAIVTLSDFETSDATTFWKDVGVAVAPDHLTKIDVDGGTDSTTAYSDGDPLESDLDVQQSGAIAPDAKVLAYVAPNISSATFLNAFEAVASDNAADVVSCSWGEAELDFFSNAITGNQDRTFYLQAFHDVFEEMATQGQTVFTDADDNGAFEINRYQYPVFPVVNQPPAYTPVYSIHHPSADPLVTAAGGTSYPFTADYSGVAIDVPQEEAWSWTYYPLGALEQGEGYAQAKTLFEETFAVGGGGGVSIYWPAPGYQKGLAGVASSMPNQALIALGGTPTLLATEPADFAGRNIPDLSANANPDIGYYVIEDGSKVTFYGGTSFVAPQFAGTLALLVQKLGHRVGQLNPLLYRLQAIGAAPAIDIATGNIWGYSAHRGFDQTTGLGRIDAERLYQGLRSLD